MLYISHQDSLVKRSGQQVIRKVLASSLVPEGIAVSEGSEHASLVA